MSKGFCNFLKSSQNKFAFVCFYNPQINVKVGRHKINFLNMESIRIQRLAQAI